MLPWKYENQMLQRSNTFEQLQKSNTFEQNLAKQLKHFHPLTHFFVPILFCVLWTYYHISNRWGREIFSNEETEVVAKTRLKPLING